MDKITFNKYTADKVSNIISLYDAENGWENLCPYLLVTEVSINDYSNIERYLLEYVRRGTNQRQTQWVTYDVLLPNGVLSLTQYGVEIPINKKNKISEMLLASLEIAKYRIQIDRFGWQKLEEYDVFIADRVFSTIDLNSKYINKSSKVDVNSCGSWDIWKQMYNYHVKGNFHLELAVIFGLSAPILNYIGNNYIPDLKSILIHFCGDSTTGKSTATMLALSTCGNPNIAPSSLLRYWSGTTTSIMSTLKGVNGIPIGFDELSTQKADSLTSLLYSLTEGVDRSRADINGDLKKTGNWKTIIISNGEQSIFNKVSNNTGLKTRLFEYSNTKWTNCASQSDTIKNIVQNNYGFALNKLISGLFIKGLDIIWETYQSEVVRLSLIFPNSRFKQRIVNKVAIFTTTAKLLNILEILEVDVDKITEILLLNEKSYLDERDLSSTSLNGLFQYLISHPKCLDDSSLIRVGKIIDDRTVFIFSHQLNEILSQLKYEDSSVIIKAWKSSGYVVKREKDRLKSRTTVDSKRVEGYYIDIPMNYREYFKRSSLNVPRLNLEDNR